MAHKNTSNWTSFKSKSPPRPFPGTFPGVDRPKAKPGSKPESKPAPKRHRHPIEEFGFAEADDRLADFFRNHGCGDISHSERHLFVQFYFLLMESQKLQNLTRLVQLRDIAIKHFVDSIMVRKITKLRYPLLDMGTGPGFPGIPLKILEPNKEIILAEGVQKRVEFLKHVREKLNLPKLPIIGRNVDLEFFYPVQGVITRAVEDARNTLGNVVNSLQTGGLVYLMKGPGCEPEIDMALNAWGEYFRLKENIAYELPQSPHQRRLLVFEKTKPHPLPDFVELDLAWEREHGLD